MSRIRYGASNIWLEIVMIAAVVAFIFPVYVMVTMAFKSSAEVAESAIALPQSLNLENFTNAWAEGELGRALANSVVVTSLSIVLLVLIGSAAAFTIVRGGRRIHGVLLMLFLLGMMIPLQLGMVPLYTLMRDLGLLQTYTSLIVFHVGSLLPITIFLYTGFLRAQSPTYEEAARVDGASQWQVYSRIAFPLLRPVTGTVIIINAINIWNDFLTPLLYLGGSDKRTLTVAIYAFRGEYATNWGMTFAGIVMAILPVLIVYFLLQKYIIKGFASGLKG
ncbi:carbohydrate ABC transporter permease [Occultella gossypii]|uniref:Carbohydrate ABC transporter permease n=1 Tax=Occultella gossypii TaxID=2800820 RepID=A0ABS7S8U4_9MICO|nr:carbohydrate ABC transporter permease [Occultella gossypii]MBZ2196044.1 carbohydrate ABC transporter permease [Occultella gossypii]